MFMIFKKKIEFSFRCPDGLGGQFCNGVQSGTNGEFYLTLWNFANDTAGLNLANEVYSNAVF